MQRRINSVAESLEFWQKQSESERGPGVRRIEKLRINIVVKVRGWHQLLPGGMCSSRSTCTSAASSSGRSLGDTRTCLLLGLPPGLQEGPGRLLLHRQGGGATEWEWQAPERGEVHLHGAVSPAPLHPSRASSSVWPCSRTTRRVTTPRWGLSFRWTARGRKWGSPPCSRRTSSNLLIAPLSKCQHPG